MSNKDYLDLPLEKPPLMENVILTKYYEDLYNILAAGGHIYTCVVDREDSTKMFFEIGEDDPDTVTCRIFWRESDMVKYINWVKTRRPQDGAEVKMWVTAIDKLITSLNLSWTKLDNFKNKTLVAIATAYDDGKYGSGEMIDVETFWSTNETFVI